MSMVLFVLTARALLMINDDDELWKWKCVRKAETFLVTKKLFLVEKPNITSFAVIFNWL